MLSHTGQVRRVAALMQAPAAMSVLATAPTVAAAGWAKMQAAEQVAEGAVVGSTEDVVVAVEAAVEETVVVAEAGAEVAAVVQGAGRCLQSRL